jgi:recombination protein RecA
MATANLLDMTDRKSADKQKALDSALAQIERQFGKGSIMKLGGDNAIKDIEATSTGSLGLDIALGIGGLPKGRIIEIYGPESSGKTTLTLHVRRRRTEEGRGLRLRRRRARARPAIRQEAGRRPRRAADLAARHRRAGAGDHRYAGALGRVSLVVVDSVAALTPKSELEGDMGDSSVGVHARLMSQAMRKLTGSIKPLELHGDLHQPDPHEDRRDVRFPETTTGGNALKFYSSVRLDIRRIGAIKDRDEVVGNADPRQGRQEQGRAAVQAGRVRHHVRRGHLQDRRAARSGRQGRRRREVGRPGSPTATNGSGRAARTPSSSCKDNPDVALEIEDKIRAAHGLDFEMEPGEAVTTGGDGGLIPRALRDRARA